jgi:hypothetical protein
MKAPQSKYNLAPGAKNRWTTLLGKKHIRLWRNNRNYLQITVFQNFKLINPKESPIFEYYVIQIKHFFSLRSKNIELPFAENLLCHT